MREIACPSCGQKRGTVQGDYQYLESGLDNVWICGLEIFQCPCGESSALIPNILELHQTIAKCLLLQKRRLTGKEIRFLRKEGRGLLAFRKYPPAIELTAAHRTVAGNQCS